MSMFENISDLEPCGVDFKYDDEYIAIELEIEKNFNVSNLGQTQWDIVILKCENVLVNHSKDLKILSYWLYAQWQLNGWTSFLKVFDIYVNILDRYNKALFPKMEKRKIKIFEWIENVLEEPLLKVLDSFEKKELNNLYTNLERLEIIIPLVVEFEHTLFKGVRIKCAKYIHDIKTKEAAKTQQLEIEQQEALKREIEDAALREADELRSVEEAEILAKFSSKETPAVSYNFKPLSTGEIDSIHSRILSLCKDLFRKSPGDYRGYKMLFSLAEILIEEICENSSKMTDNLIPSNDIIKAIRNLEEGNVSLSQLEALIEQLLLRPTWLEGYYIVSKMLYKSSQSYNANQVENMLFHFLSKEEKILNMGIRDQKIVPEYIVSWVQTKVLSSSSKDNSAIEYQQAYQEIMKIKKDKNSQDALMLLESHYQKAQGEESRFRWRLLIVDFSLEIGDKKLALSLLYELERHIEKYQINLWQPSLAITVYEMLLKPIFAQELSTDTKDRIYSKLSILDLQKVIKL